MNRIVFLGTGGGGAGFMSRQVFCTGGKYIELDGVKMILDPGPGTLVYSNYTDIDLTSLDGALLSHLHPDHSTDINAVLDGIEQDHFMIAERSCLKPTKDYYPCVTKYHQKTTKYLFAAKPNQKIKIAGLTIKTTKADHYSPSVGFRIEGSKIIGYPSDGAYHPSQSKLFSGCDVLVLNALVPSGEKSWPHGHLSVDDTVTMLRKMKKKPKLTVLQHFGFWMLKHGIDAQANIVKKRARCSVIPAKDFMEVNVNTLKTRMLLKKS